MKYEFAIQIIGYFIVILGGVTNNLIAILGGFGVILLTFASHIDKNKNKIKELSEKLKIKEEIDKIWRELDIIKNNLNTNNNKDNKMKKRGQFGPSTAIVIFLIILTGIFLWQQGYITTQTFLQPNSFAIKVSQNGCEPDTLKVPINAEVTWINLDNDLVVLVFKDTKVGIEASGSFQYIFRERGVTTYSCGNRPAVIYVN